MALIELNRVSKVYSINSVHTVALKDITLSIEEGEFVSVIGPSGSGKSTLMNIIGCLDVPTNGSYRFNGIDVGSLNDTEISRLRNRMIGFVFQQFNLLQRVTALENVMLPQIYSGKKPSRKKALELLERMGLKGHENKFPNQLSGGMQQRVAIARALVNKPRLILADEPTGALDTKTGEEILAIFEELNRSGVTLVIVTHEPYIASRAKRMISLRDGAIESDILLKESRP